MTGLSNGDEGAVRFLEKSKEHNFELVLSWKKSSGDLLEATAGTTRRWSRWASLFQTLLLFSHSHPRSLIETTPPRSTSKWRFLLRTAGLLLVAVAGLWATAEVDTLHIAQSTLWWWPRVAPWSAALSDNSTLPPRFLRFSKIQCSPRVHACAIDNLYWIDQALHAYVGDHAGAAQSLHGILNTTMYTGIGFGSPVVHFAPPPPRDGLAGQSTVANIRRAVPPERSSESTLKTWNVQIHVHYADPPAHLANDTLYLPEPTAFVSLLWENLFRTLYAGVGAWVSLLGFDVPESSLAPASVRLVLLDPQRPSTFLPLLQRMSDHPIHWLEEHPNALFGRAIVGISRHVMVPEITVETHDEAHHRLRNRAFQLFCRAFKGHLLSGSSLRENVTAGDTTPKRTVTLILREGATRRILNQKALVKQLESLPDVRVQAFEFGGMPIHKQVQIIDETDVLIAMHGAALTHTAFMRPGTAVVELFPWVFRKTVYQNLATIMGLRYQMWQNDDPQRTRFHWNLVERNRFSGRARAQIEQSPIDWRNMDSKNYWRNQDTELDVDQVLHVVRDALRALDGPPPTLLVQPWGALAEQLQHVKSACAISAKLNRTLVLPMLSGNPAARGSANDDAVGTSFSALGRPWKPMERYFQLEHLVRGLPCRVMTLHNLMGLMAYPRGLPHVSFFEHASVPLATVRQSVHDYFEKVVGLDMGVLELDPFLQLHSLDPVSLATRFSNAARSSREQSVLALGAPFPFGDFDSLVNTSHHHDDGTAHRAQTTAALERLGRLRRTGAPSFMDVPLYQQMARALVPARHLVAVAERLLAGNSSAALADSGQDPWSVTVALHLRRGDRQSKCVQAFNRLNNDAAESRLAKSGSVDDEGGTGFLGQVFPETPSADFPEKLPTANGLREPVAAPEFRFGSAGSAAYASSALGKACLQPAPHVLSRLGAALRSLLAQRLHRATTNETPVAPSAVAVRLYVVTDSVGKSQGDRVQMEAIRNKLQAVLQSHWARLTSSKNGSVPDRIGISIHFLDDVVSLDSGAAPRANSTRQGSDVKGATVSASNSGYGYEPLDTVDLALIESLVCFRAHLFIGNAFSTFSQHVAEQRHLDGRPVSYF